MTLTESKSCGGSNLSKTVHERISLKQKRRLLKMPNWFHQTLTITGPAEERERFLAECFTNFELDFHKVVPQPEHIQKSTDGGFMGPDGTNRQPDWYEWNCEHWGTKWNAQNTSITVDANTITLSFSTAWVPPIPVYVELGKKYPQLVFEGDGADFPNFSGTFRIAGDDVVSERKEIVLDDDYLKACAASAASGTPHSPKTYPKAG
jgi:Ferredoxin-like domain in Api92-like protein